MSPWLRYLIAFVVFAHGFVYLRIGSVLPSPIPAWRGSSWLFGSLLTGRTLTTTVVGLHVIAGVLIVASALAIGLAPSVPGWWRPLAAAGGTVGIVAFAVFWDGQTNLLFDEGGLGALLSALLIAAAVLFPGAFR